MTHDISGKSDEDKKTILVSEIENKGNEVVIEEPSAKTAKIEDPDVFWKNDEENDPNRKY